MADPVQRQVKKALRKQLPMLVSARDENLNEADTVRRISMVFERVLGYDPLTEISSEVEMKHKYVDLVIKIGGNIRLLIEAKAAGVTLRERHIEQAQSYASRNNYPWVLLTNGLNWNLYHLTFEEGIEYERAFSIDLEKDAEDKVAEALAVLHRQSVRRGGLDDYWNMRIALSPASLGRALFTENVLRLVRRQVRAQEGILMDVEEIGQAIHTLLTPEAREQIGPFRIRKKARRKNSGVDLADKVTERVPVPAPTTPTEAAR